MVGEIRDNETAQIAINSALTGHLVFTTVHANNVLDVLGRFLNMGVEAYQFVSALNCVLAQRLVRNICHHCKRPATVTAAAARGVGARPGARAHAHVLRGHRLHRVRRHRLQGPHGDLRAARPERPHPRDDSREAADLGDQEGGARRGHAVPARIGGRAGHGGHRRRCARSTRSRSSNEHPVHAARKPRAGRRRRDRRRPRVGRQPRMARRPGGGVGARRRSRCRTARSCRR